MASVKDIQRRIKSINNTKKITRAMEMISAVKMRKSVSNVLHIRPYAHAAWSVLTNLARAFENYKEKLGLLEVRPVRSVLIVAIAANRGLCGSFNAQIVKKIKEEIENPEKLRINRRGIERIEPDVSSGELQVDFITIGRKGEGIIRKLGKNIIASFPKLTYFPKVEDVRPVAKIVMEEYLAKKYDKAVIVYTDFISAIRQQTKIRQLLPISKVDLEKQIAEMDVLAKEFGLKGPEVEYKVEPDPKEVLNYIFPRLIEMQIYHAILESNASKEAARMMAMRNATESAGEMVDNLTLAYNQIRQTKITQEIAEISAGRVALEG